MRRNTECGPRRGAGGDRQRERERRERVSAKKKGAGGTIERQSAVEAGEWGRRSRVVVIQNGSGAVVYKRKRTMGRDETRHTAGQQHNMRLVRTRAPSLAPEEARQTQTLEIFF